MGGGLKPGRSERSRTDLGGCEGRGRALGIKEAPKPTSFPLCSLPCLPFLSTDAAKRADGTRAEGGVQDPSYPSRAAWIDRGRSKAEGPQYWGRKRVLVLDPGLRTLPAPGRVQLAFARTEIHRSHVGVKILRVVEVLF